MASLLASSGRFSSGNNLHATPEMPTEVDLDPLSVAILSLTAKLDDFQAREWNLYAIAVVTTLILFGIKVTLGKWLGIDWLAFVHALVTGIGGMLCVYLDYSAAESITGLPGEPAQH